MKTLKVLVLSSVLNSLLLSASARSDANVGSNEYLDYGSVLSEDVKSVYDAYVNLNKSRLSVFTVTIPAPTFSNTHEATDFYQKNGLLEFYKATINRNVGQCSMRHIDVSTDELLLSGPYEAFGRMIKEGFGIYIYEDIEKWVTGQRIEVQSRYGLDDSLLSEELVREVTKRKTRDSVYRSGKQEAGAWGSAQIVYSTNYDKEMKTIAKSTKGLLDFIVDGKCF